MINGFNVNNKDTRKTQINQNYDSWYRSGVFVVTLSTFNTRQPAFTCSNLLTLEEWVKSVQIQYQRQQKQSHWCRSGVFIVNFEEISNIVLVFSLSLNKYMSAGSEVQLDPRQTSMI